MSLVTRCPACGTVFRVVQDQLKVSEGWVRCGRCSEVFNAVDGLFDLEQEDEAALGMVADDDGGPAFSADESSTLEEPSPYRVDALMDAVLGATPEAARPDDAAEDVTSQARATAELAAVYARLAPGVASTDELAGASAEASVQAPADLAPDAPGGASGAALSDAAPDDPAIDSTLTTTPWQAGPDEAPVPAASAAPPTPEFVRRADRAARWRHPAVRGGLWLVSGLLAAALAAQIALHYHDGLAAHWPASRPWLLRLCAVAGCRIDAPRRIDSISVDSSGLVRASGEPGNAGGQYRLSLVLHNRSATAVLMPAIDLALTDSKGQTMIRRVLYASELGQPATSLAANSEVAMQGLLDLGEHHVIGYTIELFYP